MRLIALSIVCIFIIAMALAGIVVAHQRGGGDCLSSAAAGIARCL